jgi:HD-like signal output (HDOD) protein
MDLKQIEIKLARATTLPILPTIVTQVLAMTDSSEFGVRHYEQIIAKDAALTAKILRTATLPISEVMGVLPASSARSPCWASIPSVLSA